MRESLSSGGERARLGRKRGRRDADNKKEEEEEREEEEWGGLYSSRELKMNLFKIRQKVYKNIKSDIWSEEDLLKVIKNLKKNKSADAD